MPNAVDAHRGPRALYIFLANNYREKGLASGMLMVQSGGPTYRESSANNTTDKGLVRYAREPTQKILTFERQCYSPEQTQRRTNTYRQCS